MGCDIHFYVERRNGAGWESCDTWEKDEYAEEGHDRLSVPHGKHFYRDRNYDLFAILANVRNGSGFAGLDTGDGFEPLAQPRGLPDDLSPEMKVEVGPYLDHTSSWVTVKELLDYDWTRVTTKRGWVSGPEFDAWDGWKRERGHGPMSYSGGVSGGGVQHVSEDEMRARLKAINELKLSPEDRKTAIRDRLRSTYCQVSWQVTYSRAASEFLSETMPRLWRLGAPENVRCVFWFDS